MEQKLTLQDVIVILDIINIASTRNAFRIEEFSTVGSIFNKLSALVQSSGPPPVTPDSQPLSEESKND